METTDTIGQPISFGRAFAVLVFLFLFAAGALVFIYKGELTGIFLKKQPEPAGFIYLTLYPWMPGAIKNIPTVARFDIKTNDIQFFEGDDISITGTISPDGSQIAYSAIPYKDNESENLQIRVSDIDNSNERIVTMSPTLYKRMPKWSPDGRKLSFVSILNREDTLRPNNWGVYVTDLLGNEEFITEGANPYFSSDGKELLILRDDGLFLVSIKSKVARKTEVINGADSLRMPISFSLSKDKTMIVLSDPEQNKLSVMKITSWSPFETEIVGVFNVNANWPIFSPDNNFLAFQKIEFVEGVKELDQPHQLVIYDLKNRLEYYKFDLRPYYLDKTFVTDWTALGQ